MSEFKFACPVCGQHITCASSSAGSQMECPTCFRKLVVPQAPAKNTPGLVLTASEVSNRPATSVSEGAEARRRRREFPVAGVVFMLLLVSIGAGAFVYREKILAVIRNENASPEDSKKVQAYVPPTNDTNWTLNLTHVKLPETRATGRIHGHDFTLERATLQGGTLSLRQGQTWPPDVGMTLMLYARSGEDLAGKTINIQSEREKSPKLILRWKDAEQKPVSKTFTHGYALRLEFGEVKGKHISGKLYLCAPDDEHSYVAGTFSAEIRKPAAKTQQPKK